MYLIAFWVGSETYIAPVSCFAQDAHLNPLSLKLKCVIFSLVLHDAHSLMFGPKPIIFSNRNLKTVVIKSKSRIIY